MPERPTHA